MWRMAGVAAVLVAALALPGFVTVPYFLHLVILALIWVVLAQGQNLIQGFTGYVSIAQAGFMGIGAYSSTLMSVKLGWPVWVTIAVAPLTTAVLALLAGYPSLRVKGHYFAIVTLAYNMVIFIVLMTWSSLTGGEAGIANVPRPADVARGWLVSGRCRRSLLLPGAAGGGAGDRLCARYCTRASAACCWRSGRTNR